VFRKSGVVHSFKVVDPVLFVFESHVLYSLLLLLLFLRIWHNITSNYFTNCVILCEHQTHSMYKKVEIFTCYTTVISYLSYTESLYCFTVRQCTLLHLSSLLIRHEVWTLATI
jgi:hypothetical protein